ncbi:carbamoyltransferase N-terminal domain-containing protein [Actinoplanes sp. NEAU-A12]|uniref:Carbamoyltransferase N-terminal domain-containing protein n=1 Tax=Actinoplanes sandaracinus TaxID=3045177 RepID=A0ABT6WZK7_9ACTN|nr:carbamoyltransferase N-terminal domain-containing protein [Actinoplanes sandaracinus]MDI6105179.1 carbamoyltransferase N-terminal domain-containing protein [Actinoplanes sandaracinus]
MIIAGLKLTKSGGIAVLRDRRVEICIDFPAGTDVDLDAIPAVLAAHGYAVDDVAEWVIDGWNGDKNSLIPVRSNGVSAELTAAGYQDGTVVPEPDQPAVHGRFDIAGQSRPYASYVHVASQVAAAYSSSPFGGASATVLVWDDGCFPRLYRVTEAGRIVGDGALFPLPGHAFALAGQHFGPSHGAAGADADSDGDPGNAGRVRSLAAHGRVQGGVLAVLAELFEEHFEADSAAARQYRQAVVGCGGTAEPSHRYVHAFLRDLRSRTAGVADAHVLASLRSYLGSLLVERLDPATPVNLCFTGSAALDPQWVSALREHPAVEALWVPPFPDDSGSALGAAALHLGRDTGLPSLDWSVARGVAVARRPHVPADWTVAPMRPEELARLLLRTGRPALLVQGRATVGPLALGGRAVLASAAVGGIDGDVVALCLAEYAEAVFEPGTEDRYGQFEHRVRPEWTDRIPAAVSPDGTARVQTVGADDDPILRTILREFHAWSGVPVVLGVAAHPYSDVASALLAGGEDTVWSDSVLYRRAYSA